ncbi:MAG TPA: dienelactone hydrolase family protein [Cyclobacteriaceae bacterium]|nr:dienelactone hydrolase family protein [Cyclobacteriaceae bacterium]
MPRSFYSFSILVNVLIAGMALTEALLYSRIGNMMAYVQSYPNWLLATLIFYSLQAGVMLKYFQARHYKTAFRIGIAYFGSLVLFLFINYAATKFALGRELYIPLYITMLFLQVVYNATLALSASRERTWLRIAGISAALLSVVTLAPVSILMSGKFFEYHSAIENLHGPILWGGVLVPVMLAINFYRQWRTEPIADQPAQPVFNIPSAITLLTAMFFLVSFIAGGYRMKSSLPSMDAAIKKVAEPFDARAYVDMKGDTLKYRLLKPLDYDSTKTYPLVVCLHGSSGTGSDNYRQVAAALLPEFLTTESNREKFRAFIFVPQCKFATSWGGTHPLPGIDQIVFEAMFSLDEEFSIDPDRRYVTGISLGGYGAWHFINSHPEVFAAAIPICGHGDPALAPKSVNIPVWAFHGAKDDRVSVDGSRDMINSLRAAGGNPKYTEFPDAGHDIGRSVCETPGLLDWLFAQRRGDSTSN